MMDVQTTTSIMVKPWDSECGYVCVHLRLECILTDLYIKLLLYWFTGNYRVA